jgi:hypothetical protein
MKEKFVGKKCIVRCDRAGVFFGEVVDFDSTMIELKNARKIFYWTGAAAIEQLAVDGTNEPNACKFTVSVEKVVLTQHIQIIPCTEKSIDCIEKVKEWKR